MRERTLIVDGKSQRQRLNEQAHRWEAIVEPRLVPCIHLGHETGETVQCDSCAGKVSLKLLACRRHGACTTSKPVEGHACCATCSDYEPDPFHLVAPLGTADQRQPWSGRGKRLWSGRVTVAVPHLNTLDLLPTALDLWRAQTERPYLMVIDTGSPPAVCEQLEQMRAPDLEVHYLRAHGYCHSSAPVTTALDCAHALCRTSHLLHTHADVFPRRRDLVAWLLGQCSANAPAVGWEMSPRSQSPLWKGTLSHTCTMLHMPTMRRIGANWSMEGWYERHGRPAQQTVGWPDTESPFKDCLSDAGVIPVLLGSEPNFELHQGRANYIDDDRVWFDHARSVTGSRAYGHGLAAKIEAYAAQALAEAKTRAAQWRAEG